MHANTHANNNPAGDSPPQADSGCYVLLLRLAEDAIIQVGSLGSIDFRAGSYAYVGRARKNLAQRIARHLRGSDRLRWHVDYLRLRATVERVYVSDSLDECAIAARVAALPDAEVVARFGSSDCRCPGHLIRLQNKMPDLDGLRDY